MQKEIFKDIPDFEGHYQVSNFGRVKSLKWGKQRILKPTLSGSKYLIVGFFKNNNKRESFSIHQLVAIVFHNHIPNGYSLVVNHIDSNKLNNRADNIEITTQRKNTSKKHLKSSSKYVGVHWNKKAKKWRASIYINRKIKHLGSFTDEKEASDAYQKALKNLNDNV